MQPDENTICSSQYRTFESWHNEMTVSFPSLILFNHMLLPMRTKTLMFIHDSFTWIQAMFALRTRLLHHYCHRTSVTGCICQEGHLLFDRILSLARCFAFPWCQRFTFPIYVCLGRCQVAHDRLLICIIF